MCDQNVTTHNIDHSLLITSIFEVGRFALSANFDFGGLEFGDSVGSYTFYDSIHLTFQSFAFRDKAEGQSQNILWREEKFSYVYQTRFP